MCTIDLEDSVPEQSKEEARRLAMPFFTNRGERRPGSPLRMVRINCLRTPDGLRDILALLDSGARPDALFVPKVDSAQDLLILEEVLGERLAATFFVVLIETAAGLCAVDEIAAATPRLRALAFGGADFSAEMGISMGWDQLAYARSRIVVAATRAGIAAMDSPYFELENPAGLYAETHRSRAFGFQGRVAVHPRQVPTINAEYTPKAEAVARARRVVAATEEHHGQIAVLDGDMIGPPMLLAARRLLALAEKIGEKETAKETEKLVAVAR
jgi:(S)-citramalyl-CoA lyase